MLGWRKEEDAQGFCNKHVGGGRKVERKGRREEGRKGGREEGREGGSDLLFCLFLFSHLDKGKEGRRREGREGKGGRKATRKAGWMKNVKVKEER